LHAQASLAYNPCEKISFASLSRLLLYDSTQGLLWLKQEGNAGSSSGLSGEPL
jgi:hypothetical protein